MTPSWPAEQRVHLTEVFLALVWCSAAAYLSFFFANRLLARWLLRYTAPAACVRLLTLDALIAYCSRWAMFLSGAAADPRLLLPAWVGITSSLIVLYLLGQRKADLRREREASLVVYAGASFVSMAALLLQLHLTREEEPVVPLFVIFGRARKWVRGLVWSLRA